MSSKPSVEANDCLGEQEPPIGPPYCLLDGSNCFGQVRAPSSDGNSGQWLWIAAKSLCAILRHDAAVVSRHRPSATNVKPMNQRGFTFTPVKGN
jgi:hypothetical protein